MLKSRRCDIGRYFNGDINGKFWFAVQNSDAADRFGVAGVQPEELHYYFSDSDLQAVKDEILKIENSLGSKLAKLDEFYLEYYYYAEDDLCQLLSVDHGQIAGILSEYADLELGRKIRDCIEENGSCEFIAELNKGLNVIHRKVDKGYTIWYCYSDENQKLGVIGKIERTLTQEEKTAFTADVRRFFLGTGIHKHSITDACDEIKSSAVRINEIKQFQMGMQCGSDIVYYTHGNYTTDSILSCPLRQYIEKRKFFVTWYGKEREIKAVIQTGTLEGLKYD